MEVVRLLLDRGASIEATYEVTMVISTVLSSVSEVNGVIFDDDGDE